MHGSRSIHVDVGAQQAISPGVNLRDVIVDGNRGQVAPFRAALFDVSPGNATVPERHAVREMWFALSGSGCVRTDRGDTPIDAGQVVYIEGGLEHSAVNGGAQTLSILTVWWPAAAAFDYDRFHAAPEPNGV